jgi:Tfp pilus assembly protein FimT
MVDKIGNEDSKFEIEGGKMKTKVHYDRLHGFNLKPQSSNLRRTSLGFTSVELVIVIVCLSVLAGTAVVSFRLSDEDKSTIAADQLIADIQYVQMRAMGIGSAQSIEFRYDTGDYSAYRILNTDGKAVENKKLPDDVTIESNNFNNTLKFNSLGEPFYGSDTSCTSATGGNCSVTLRNNVIIMVYAITGKTCLYDAANSRCF